MVGGGFLRRPAEGALMIKRVKGFAKGTVKIDDVRGLPRK